MRAITPELATYSYPPYEDAKREYGKQRCVLLLDVLDKAYANHMRQNGIQRLQSSDDARLITLQSTIDYLASLLRIEFVHFHNHDDGDSFHTVQQGLFIRFAALIECVADDKGAGSGSGSGYACVLSAVMLNVIEGFARDNPFSLALLAFLQNEGLIAWEKKGGSGKDVMNVMDGGNGLEALRDETRWQDWNEKYFGNAGNAPVEELKNGLLADRDMMKLYKRLIRHVPRYSVVRRPGEDTFVLP